MNQDKDVVIVDGVRTAIGTFGGSLVNIPSRDLGSTVIREALNRSRVEAQDVDEVVMGCVGQIGDDAYISRTAAIGAGIPEKSTAHTVNRLCASGLQAIITATQWLKLDDAQMVVAGGVENMSRHPYYIRNRWGRRLQDGILEDGLLAILADPFEHYQMGVTAENVAERFHVTRMEQDRIAYDSQVRAKRAVDEGRFESQIVPVMISRRGDQTPFTVDEHPRNTTLEKLQQLPTVFKEGGTVTAGNASGINDGAAAVVMTTAGEAQRRGLTPKARIVSYAVAGIDPSIMGYAPTYAISQCLTKASMSLNDIDLIEFNEAFAAQVAAVVRDAHLDWERTNVNGGAIALGHPIGATGAILTVKLLYELERIHAQYGMVTLCIGGGQGMALIVENYQR